jgi:alkanesulfonate monooxygenase SsuD/methylene tetrahydromethanopterin reductase-like flavin-dependent oxidoreductase (luciferase family)
MHRVWKGELVNGALKPIGPAPVRPGGVPILIGGYKDKAIERLLKWGTGWTVGGAAPEQAGPMAERVRVAWKEAGKEGQPRVVGLTYYALGDGGPERAARYLSDYYGDFGPKIAGRIPKTPEALRETLKKFEDFGFDELFVDPTSAELDQIDLAASAVL